MKRNSTQSKPDAGLKMTFDFTKPFSCFVPWECIMPNPEQPRDYFDEDAQGRLDGSLEDAQENPVTVIPWTEPKKPKISLMIIDGERRWRSCKRTNKNVWIVYKPGTTRENIHRASFKSNFCKEDHTYAEAVRAIAKEYNSSDGQTFEQIAKSVGKTGTWAWQYYQLTKLHPDLLKQMDPPTPEERRISFMTALQLIKKSPDEQLKIWKKASDPSSKKRTYHKVLKLVGDSGRSPHDNRRYLSGKMKRLHEEFEHLLGLPESYFGSLRPEEKEDLAKLALKSGALIVRLYQKLGGKKLGEKTTPLKRPRPVFTKLKPLQKNGNGNEEPEVFTPFTDKDFPDVPPPSSGGWMETPARIRM